MNKQLLLLAALTALCVLTAGACRRKDIQTAFIEVPQLRGESCIQYLGNVIGAVDGVDRAALRIEPGKLWVTYDSMKLALKNLEHAIAQAGFQANDIPANPEARQRLPESCR